MSIASPFLHFFLNQNYHRAPGSFLKTPKFKKFWECSDGEADRPPGKIMLLGPKKSFQSWRWRLQSKLVPPCILSQYGRSASTPVQAAMHNLSRSTLRNRPLLVRLDVLVLVRDVVTAQLQRTPLPTQRNETNDLFAECIVDPCTDVAIFIFHNLLYKHLYQEVKRFLAAAGSLDQGCSPGHACAS